MTNKLKEEEIIFSTVTGSTAYGTNSEGSDIDIRGVAIRKDPGYYFGFFKKFEQQQENDEDTVIYDIRKAFSLMADCNPNMIELLFIDERFWNKTTEVWDEIVANRDKFLSKRARYTYVGYAYAQLKRIKTARGWLLNPPTKRPERSDFGLNERRELTKDEMGAFKWIMVYLLKDSIDYLNFSDAVKEELDKVNFIGLIQSKGIPDEAIGPMQNVTGASDEWMHIMQKEQAYANAKRQWDAYMSWKNGRNKKRAALEEKFGFDCKHAAHLVRLLRQGKEIITEGKVIVYRPDREELKAIKAGSWLYEMVEQYADKMEQEIATLSETSKLPKEPDRNFLDKLCIDTIQKYLGGK